MSDQREQNCIMPLVMSKSEWGRIQAGRKQHEDPDAKRRLKYVQQLDAASQEMTKTWPNSLENVNKRNEEERRLRNEATESANNKFYKKYLKRKKEEQRRLMTSARQSIFKNKDAPKLMLSAVIASRTLKEREEQVKFLAELKRQAAEKVKQDDMETIRKGKEWEQHVANQKRRRREENKQHQKDILEQAHEISEKNRREYETELKMQLLDNKKAHEQMRALKEFEEDYKVKKKAEILAGLTEASRQCDRRKAELVAIDRMDNRLIAVLNKSRARIENKRKQTEIAERQAKLKVLEAISNKLQSGDADREAHEQAILDKACKEAEIIVEERLDREAANRARIRKERNDVRAQWLRDEQRRLHEQRNLRSWDCINRFKNMEIYDDYKKRVHQEERRKINQFRDDMLFQIKERKDREARERAETRYFYGELALSKLRDADNKLLTHTDQLLQEARDTGCPEFPLRSCIDRYCNLYRLYPMPDLPASLKEHFTRYHTTDGSRPDPGYRDPATDPAPATAPAPVPARNPHVSGAAPNRNGLNDPVKPSTSGGDGDKKKKKEVADFKRAAPANGLQRKLAHTDLTLPAINVLPCRNKSCTCELRQ